MKSASSNISLLKWDSHFFGFNVAAIKKQIRNPKAMSSVNKFIKKNKVRLVQYLCNCHDPEVVDIAEKYNFNFKDIRITFFKELKRKEKIYLKKDLKFKKAKNEDINKIMAISSTLYRASRYYFDKKFNRKKIKFFFKNWVEKGVKGNYDDECVCLLKNKKIIAFCTLRYFGKTRANIGLFGVARKYIGKGNGQYFLSMIFNYLRKKNMNMITVVTQGRNYRAQNLYQKMGFRIKKTELWYHKWI